MKPILTLGLLFLFLMPSNPSSAAELSGASSDIKQFIEKGLLQASKNARPSGPPVFIPVAYIRIAEPGKERRQWSTRSVPIPSARNVPNFPDEALKTLRADLEIMKQNKSIDAYVLVHSFEEKVRIVVWDGEAPPVTFEAPCHSQADLGKLKIADFTSM